MDRKPHKKWKMEIFWIYLELAFWGDSTMAEGSA